MNNMKNNIINVKSERVWKYEFSFGYSLERMTEDLKNIPKDCYFEGFESIGNRITLNFIEQKIKK